MYKQNILSLCLMTSLSSMAHVQIIHAQPNSNSSQITTSSKEQVVESIKQNIATLKENIQISQNLQSNSQVLKTNIENLEINFQKLQTYLLPYNQDTSSPSVILPKNNNSRKYKKNNLDNLPIAQPNAT